jgi:hypothetical protein
VEEVLAPPLAIFSQLSPSAIPGRQKDELYHFESKNFIMFALTVSMSVLKTYKLTDTGQIQK